jgi:hypothetical protein
VGTAVITVFDSRNLLNNDTITVHVTPISYMNWLEEKMEIKERDEGLVSLIAYDEKGNKFTNCSSLLHTIEYDSKHISFIDSYSLNWEGIKKFTQ